MEREISIHRALAQLKTTTSRIDQMINLGVFIETTMGKSGTAHGKSLDVCKKSIQSNYDAVTKLIDNYKTIKLAIIRANSGINEFNNNIIDRVEVLGTPMTVSEMLCIHSYVIPYQTKLLKTLEKQYRTATMKVEESQAIASNQLAKMIAQMSNTDNSNSEKLSKETIEQISTAYRENNCISLVDPLDLSTKIDELKKYIEDFEESCDATLSEQNSIKKITVDFDD